MALSFVVEFCCCLLLLFFLQKGVTPDDVKLEILKTLEAVSVCILCVLSG